ncbi:Uncharacterised protein [Mycobacteroides abscessus subsp. abscessus]|nr:Uncharacterised protein [Mycobacteroides abscessus subsp. abscessus]
MPHRAPAERQLLSGLAVLARQRTGGGIPPADGAIRGSERGQQRPVDPCFQSGEPAVPVDVERQRVGEGEVGKGALDQGEGFHRAGPRRGQPGQRIGHQPGAEAVADQVDARRAVGARQRPQQGPEAAFADHAGAVLHLVIAHGPQQLPGTGPQPGEGIARPLSVSGGPRGQGGGMPEHLHGVAVQDR